MKRLLIPLLAVILAGCAVQLETPAPVPEEAPAAEQVRQREALRADVLAEIAGPAGEHAAAQLEALGGVWQPWPEGEGPTDAPTPAPADITVPTNDGALAELLAETTPDLIEAAIMADDDAATALYASIALSRAADEATARASLGQEVAPEWPERFVTSVPAVIRALDEAAYALDTLAAADSAAESDSSAQADAARFRAWSDASAEALGIVGTPDDPREPLYSLASVERAEIYAGLAETLLSVVPSAADRTLAFSAAQACAVQAVMLGADLGALPGLTTPVS